MSSILRWTLCLWALSWACPQAYAFTANDYNNAGLKLYGEKNYSQAVSYFSAALNLEPDNPTALQSRANSYYFLGQTAEALKDYEKILAKNPSNAQVAQFVQTLRDKLSQPTPSPAGTPGSLSLMEHGMALYQQKQYDAAVSVFQEAVQSNPNDAKAYYYLGATQVALGSNREAVLNLTLSTRKNPNPTLESYVTQLKGGLSNADKIWVEDQLMSGAGNAGPKKLGLRLQPALAFLKLNDFLSAADTGKKTAAQNQATNYTFDSALPDNYVRVGLEPVVALSPSFEIGLPFAIAPLGNIKESASDNTGLNQTATYALSSFSAGLDLRFLVGPGPVKFFIGGGGILSPVSLNFTGNDSPGGASTITTSYSGSFSAMAFGAQGQGGVEYRIGDSFGVALFGEYHTAAAEAFKGNLTISPTGSPTTTDPGQWVVYDTPNGPWIQFLKDGSTAPAGSRPLKVDLSGLAAGLQLSVFF